MSELDSLAPVALIEEADRVLASNGLSGSDRDALQVARDDLAGVDLAAIENTDPRRGRLVEALRRAAGAPPRLAAPSRPVTPKMTYFFVALSLLFMYLVASLTIVYNKGITLLGDAEVLAARQPDRRFGQLERQLLVAKAQLFAGVARVEAGSGDCVPGQGECPPPAPRAKVDDLAQESAYILMHELRDLDMQIALIENRISQFNDEVWAPFPGLGRVWTAVQKPFVALAGATSEAKPGKGEVGDAKEDNMPATIVACQLARAGSGAQDKPAEGGISLPSLPTVVLGMNMSDVVRQACDMNVRYTSITIPSVPEWVFRLKNLTNSYSSWILPCLYATLGSVIFFMRLILDPANPNPALHRVVHRLALAALAGIAIGWLWEPALGGTTNFNAIGAGLFTLAFVVGFSIDIFFTLLDRLAKLSSGAIERIGN